MKYAVIYSSETGNTARLAEVIRQELGGGRVPLLWFAQRGPGREARPSRGFVCRLLDG